jgi:pimeloyl-ACP methyl ester carboxylesterase
MVTLEKWLRAGQRVLVDLPAREPESPGGQALRDERFPIFCKARGSSAEGAGRPVLTMLHGFPTSSWDFAKLMPLLDGHFWPLMFDFLGFGDSDKPRGYPYSIHRQADVTEGVWARFKVKKTWLLAHDYAVSVAQELLARQQRMALGVEIVGVTFLNGGLYPDLHRALLVQRLLRSPVTGPLVSRLVTEGAFRRGMAQVISKGHPLTDDELRQHWQSITLRGGHRMQHELIHYIGDRERHRERWQMAFESECCPMQLAWGMLDPVSGAHVARRVAERKPGSRLLSLDDVGHYPQLEAPVAVADAVIAFARR